MRAWIVVGLVLGAIAWIPPPAAASTDLAWDCVYDVDWFDPDEDLACPWTKSVGTPFLDILDNGDVFRMSSTGAAGTSVSYLRTAIPFNAMTGFQVEFRFRLATFADSAGSTSVLIWTDAPNNCGITIRFEWPGNLIVEERSGGSCAAAPVFSESLNPDTFYTIRLIVEPRITTFNPMKIYRDGTLKKQITPDWSAVTTDTIGRVDFGISQSPIDADYDYMAYDESMDLPPGTINDYPLPRIRPAPYPIGTRDSASSSFFTTIYDWRDNDAATPAAFNLPYPLGEGSVQVRRDALYVDKSQNTQRLWINDTKSTSSTTDDTILWNATTSLVFLDLTTLSTSTDGENVTVQEGSGSTSYRTDRETVVQLTRGFNWSLTGNGNERRFILSLTNNATRDWFNVWFSVPFDEDTDAQPSSVSVFDEANSQELVPGLHFLVTGGGVEFDLASIPDGISRTFRITYTPTAQAEFSVIRLEATSAVPDNTFAGVAFRARVTHMQTPSQEFLGDVVIAMNVADPSFSGRFVDMGTVILVDVRTGIRVTNWFPHLTQPNLIVVPDQRIPAGAVQSYDIYFAFRPTETGSIGGFLGSSLGALAFLIVLILMLVFALLAAKDRGYLRLRRRS